MTEEAKKVLARLQNQCARREYCESDVLEKAAKALDGDRAQAAEVVASLVEDKYVDNLRYASAFARDKSSLTGWGPVKIRYALAAKRVPSSVIGEALSEIDPEKSSDRLEKFLQSRWKMLSGDPQAKLKLIKAALSRGFEYDAVKSVVEKVSSPD